MTRPVVIGNSRLHVGINEKGEVADLYYPYVGYSSHIRRLSLGIYEDGKGVSWIHDGWRITQNYLPDVPIGLTQAVSEELKLEVTFTDFVHDETDLFWRRIQVRNQAKYQRDLILFLYADLNINGNPFGDTVVWDPRLQAIIQYKHQFYFASSSTPRCNQYATGRKKCESEEGTWVDADDGILSKQAISWGYVDFCMGWDFNGMPPGSTRSVDYVLAGGNSLKEVERALAHAKAEVFEDAKRKTERYWRSWIGKVDPSYSNYIGEPAFRLLKRSLITIRLLTNENGAIISSSDSDMFKLLGDTYAYVWFRDAAWAAMALDIIGYIDITQRFYHFALDSLTKYGYFVVKYYPTGMPGSTWHTFPFIQIDECGTLLHTLLNHYVLHKDVEFIKDNWAGIKKAGDFLTKWRDGELHLPHPSWDLWEENKAVSTYSASATYAGLRAAAQLGEVVGRERDVEAFSNAAKEVRQGILTNLYDNKIGRFLKSVSPRDESVDTSLLGVFLFGVLPPGDERVSNTVRSVEETLWVNVGIGGLARHQDDKFLRVSKWIPGNPWVVNTLYLALYYIAIGDLSRGRELVEWAVKRSLNSGLLPEQVDPYDGEAVSATPLTWSHGAFVIAVERLVEALHSESP